MRTILEVQVPGAVVEAGCFKGGSTAKFSLAARLAGREFIVFDSFEGIPANDEDHGRNIYGQRTAFPQGSYRGGLEEVRHNIASYGDLGVCTFHKGWFDETMADFDQPLAAVYLDVDLESSTRTCLRHLYPLIRPGGVLFSQDGHLPRVIEVFRDDAFWRDELGCERPEVQGLGNSKLLRIDKPRSAASVSRLAVGV